MLVRTGMGASVLCVVALACAPAAAQAVQHQLEAAAATPTTTETIGAGQTAVVVNQGTFTGSVDPRCAAPDVPCEPAPRPCSADGGGCPVDDLPRWSIIGRVGTGPWRAIGDGAVFSTPGPLQLLVNDDDYADNDGSFAVDVDVRTPTVRANISNVTLSPSTLRPRTAQVDVGAFDVPAPFGDAGSGTLAAAPFRSSPFRSSPFRSSPFRSSPFRSSPLSSSPLRESVLGRLSLAELPLRTGSWEDLLAGTALDVPPATLTLDRVLSAEPPIPGVAALTLDDIALERTPLRTASVGSILLAGLTLRELGAPFADEPGVGWCDVVDDRAPCEGDGLDQTLLDLENAGVDLTDVLDRLDLRAPASHLGDTPLGRALVSDLDLTRTPLASATFPDGTTVAQALAQRTEPLRLAELVPGFLPPDELPFEHAPLRAVLDRAPLRTTDLMTLNATFGYTCAIGGRTVIEVRLPPGARPVPGSARIGPYEVGDPTGDEVLTYDLTELRSREFCLVDPFDPDDPYFLPFSAQFEPPAQLGPVPVHVTAHVVAATGAGESTTASVQDVDDAGSTAATAAPLGAGLRTGYVAEPGDIDAYRIPAPPAGSRVTVVLSHLAADYDLTVTGPPTGVEAAPFRSSPFRSSPFRSSPLFDDLGERSSAQTPDTLQDLPFRSSELEDTPVRSSSINRGIATESATFTVAESDQGEDFVVRVTGFNGASSGQPYLLRTEVVEPPPPPPCRPSRDLPAAARGAFPRLPVSPATQTIFLVNQQRLAQLHPGSDVAGLRAKLDALAARSDVRGVVVPVESDPDHPTAAAYAALDAEPCSTERANNVASGVLQVLRHVAAGLPDLRHVVLVGSDDVLPHVRVPDMTTVANEREEAGSLVFGERDTAVSRALRDGYLLTDDAYGDADPQAWAAGETFIPDMAVGRLVETPAQIAGQIDAFTSAQGALATDTAHVAGYDFLSDGAAAILTRLQAITRQSTSTIDETWDATSARDALNRPQAGISSVNAHYDHFRALPARAFNSGVPDLLRAAQVSPAAGSLLFTAGCHAGLNVPDTGASGAGPTDGPRLRDWAEQLAAQRSVYVAHTTYGYGDTEAVGYSERLLELFAEGMASAQATVGQALMIAKQRYLAEQATPGVYDVKVGQSLTFYGLPFFRMGPSGGVAPSALPPEPVGGTPPVLEAPFEVEPGHSQVSDAERGTYFVADGERPQVTHLRPIQPRRILDVTAPDGKPVHGALVTALDMDAGPEIDPVFSRPTIDLAANEPEIEAETAIFPASVQRTSRSAATAGLRDLLVLVTGQWDGAVRRQHLFTRIGGVVLRSDSGDYDPPRMTDVGATVGAAAGGTRPVTFSVRARDTDVQRGVVLFRTSSTGTIPWQDAELTHSGGGVWTATVQVPDTVTLIPAFTVQLADDAGNVGVSTNKGPGYVGLPTAGGASPRVVLTPARPDTGVYGGPVTVEIDPRGSVGETFTYRVDGGPGQTYTEPFQVTGDGAHTVHFAGSSGSVGGAAFSIDTSGPTVTGSVSPAPSPEGFIAGPATVTWACADGNTGVERCPPPTIVDQEGLDRTVTSQPAVDTAGHTATGTVSGLDVDMAPPGGTLTETGLTATPLSLQLPLLTITLRLGQPITGTATDSLAGVRSVRVEYQRTTGTQTVSRTPSLSCGADHRSCRWTAPPPPLGLWSVVAVVTDRAGRMTRLNGARTVLSLG